MTTDRETDHATGLSLLTSHLPYGSGSDRREGPEGVRMTDGKTHDPSLTHSFHSWDKGRPVGKDRKERVEMKNEEG